MGGVFNFVDFNQASTSKRSSYKDHPDGAGLQAPRNSLEMSIQKSRGFHRVNDDIPYSYLAKQASLGRSNYLSEGPMKKLIEEDLMKQSTTRRSVPSVVARLMGMDMLPSDVNQVNFTNKKIDEPPNSKVMFHEESDSGSIRGRSPFGLKPSNQSKHNLDAKNAVQHRQSKNLSKTRKPQPREHPQEEELQKFKKEFEAWQAAMFWERSKSVTVGNFPKILKDDQVLAQELLSKEKMVRYADDHQNFAYQLPIPIKYKKVPYGFYGSSADKFSNGERTQAVHLKSRSMPDEVDQITYRREIPNKFSKPTRIVILKPGSDRDDETEDSWPGSSEREECSLEDFLEEVKERLRFEIQGNGKRSTNVRGFGVETPFKERPSNAKDIARHIATHVRENITKDLGMKLLRSESTRSCRNELQSMGDSPGFINEDTRKFVSERLNSVLLNEVNAPNHKRTGFRASAFASEATKPRSMPNFMNTGREASPPGDGLKEEMGVKSGSFRHQDRDDNESDNVDVSPRSLVRSLSAPVSGTSFGKLLLEEPHVLTGAQIRRKLEAAESVPNEVRQTRKERFSLRGKVSHLRYSLTLKGKLFGKRIQFSEGESAAGQSDSVKPFLTSPTAVMNVGNALENSTEVPPSPASVCSSSHEEFSRPRDHPSPVSPLDVPFADKNSVSDVFKEINSNLYELRQQLNRLHCDRWEEAETSTEDDPSVDSDITELECEVHVYIRDLLIAAGLYNGCTTVLKPIENWVFKEVEEAYRKGREGEEDPTFGTAENHKILFDLLNETLLTTIDTQTRRSRFIRKISTSSNLVVLHGKKLLDDTWQKLRLYIYPPAVPIHSMDSMVAHDLRRAKWFDRETNEVDIIGKEVERMIWVDLVEEAMIDMCIQ